MQFYHDEAEKFSDSEVLVPLSPNFNTSSYLEFQVNPTGGHLQLSDTRLTLSVDLPEDLVPENFFVSKLFECCEISINHSVITSRSSDNDYALTNYFMTRMNWDEATLRTTGSLEGYWENRGYDASHFELTRENGVLKESNASLDRRREAERIKIDDKIFYRYHFIVRINSGLAMTPQPLPKNVPIKLKFFRADAEKSLLAAELDNSGEPLSKYNSRVIKLINPLLHASFIQSEHYDRKYANHRISRVQFPFLDFQIHRELLLNGVDQFKIKICDGKY